VAHLVIILSAVELTRDASFWKESTRAASVRAAAEGGGSQVHLLQLSAPAPAPRVVVSHPTPPVRVPTTIPPPEPAPAAPVVDTVPRTVPADSSGSGGGSGGTSGSGAGPGGGPGTAAVGTRPDSTRLSGRPPEPRQLILPPFDYPRSLRGQSIDVNFFVLADGRVDHVVFVPEISDRAYSKKLEDAMRAYRFRPARSPEGQAVPGVAIVRVSF